MRPEITHRSSLMSREFLVSDDVRRILRKRHPIAVGTGFSIGSKLPTTPNTGVAILVPVGTARFDRAAESFEEAPSVEARLFLVTVGRQSDPRTPACARRYRPKGTHGRYTRQFRIRRAQSEIDRPGAGNRRHHRVVKLPVRRQNLTGFHLIGSAIEPAHPPAGFLQDQHTGRGVPGVQIEFPETVAPPHRQMAQIEGRGTSAPDRLSLRAEKARNRPRAHDTRSSML